MLDLTFALHPSAGPQNRLLAQVLQYLVHRVQGLRGLA